jgi:hypothetical protein
MKRSFKVIKQHSLERNLKGRAESFKWEIGVGCSLLHLSRDMLFLESSWSKVSVKAELQQNFLSRLS